MRESIRKILEEAVKEIDEVDVIRVLNTSLYLRMKMCFRPRRFPRPRPPSPITKQLQLNGNSLLDIYLIYTASNSLVLFFICV